MNQSTLTFAEVVATLEAAQIPCIVKHYVYENGDTRYSIEFGFNWPEELVDAVDNAFGGTAPDYVSMCADSSGPNEVARKKIAGGQQNYRHLPSWG